VNSSGIIFMFSIPKPGHLVWKLRGKDYTTCTFTYSLQKTRCQEWHSWC